VVVVRFLKIEIVVDFLKAGAWNSLWILPCLSTSIICDHDVGSRFQVDTASF